MKSRLRSGRELCRLSALLIISLLVKCGNRVDEGGGKRESGNGLS